MDTAPESPSEDMQPGPYGPRVEPHKGVTRRGKAALGVGAAVLAAGGLIGYQAHSATMAEHEAKAQEIALKMKALELQERQENSRAEQARQVQVDACVKNSAHLIGKGYGSPSRRDVVEDCQAQYAAGTSSDDMQSAASASSPGGGDVNQGLLIGGAVLAVVVVVAARKGTKSNAA